MKEVAGVRLPYGVKAALTRARSAAWAAGAGRRPETGGLRILLYHRVAADGDPLAVPPARFREQMDHLAAEGYRAVDLVEGLDQLERGGVGERTVALTFDDGFTDVAEEALPALERHGFRATVFVTTGVAAGEVMFPWYHGPQPPVLGWDDVAALDREGTLRFEAHTVTHPNLLALDDESAAAEIGGSRRELAERLGRPVSAFAYPAGLYGERERRLVAEAGYAAAVSCEPGVNLPGGRPVRPPPAADRLARPPARLQGEARRRARHAAAAPDHLPPAALPHAGEHARVELQ